MSLSLSLCPPLTVTVPRARAFQISTNQSRFRRYEENSDAVMDSPDSDRLLYSQHVCVCVCVCVCERERESAEPTLMYNTIQCTSYERRRAFGISRRVSPGVRLRSFVRYTLDHILSTTTTTNLFYRNTPSFAIIIRPVSQGLCRPAPMGVEDLAASMQAGDHLNEKSRNGRRRARGTGFVS
jgi:hypothetical protein